MTEGPAPQDEHRALVAANFRSIDARLEALEKPEESWTAKLQKRGSLVALVIGILLSAISLFDVFWAKPREANVRDLEEFNKAVNAVANLRQSMVQMQFQSQNPEMMMAINSMVMPQVLANIQYATTILPRLGDQAGIPQLIVLINEAMNIYDWKTAALLVDKAVSAKRAIPSMQSEARRYRARLMFATGKQEEGRKAYQDALDVLGKETAYGIAGTRAYIVAEWITSESMVGNCPGTRARAADFAKVVDDRQFPAYARTALVSSLRSHWTRMGTGGCPMPDELQSLR